MNITLGGMGLIDVLIIVIIGLSILMGFARGFISEVISLLSLIAAIFIAVTFTNPLATYFTGTETVRGVVSQTSSVIGVSTAQPVSYVAIGISFAILFVVVLIIGAIIKMILNLAFQTGILGFGNRILGAGFGFVRGLLFVMVFIFLVQLSPLAQQSWWQQSRYVPLFQPSVVWLASIVSPALENLKNTFGNSIEGATSAIQNMTK